MKTTLLIGNGLNRCLKNSISWGDLLKNIAEDYSVEYNGKIPMPLEFECIINQCLKSQTEPSDKIYMEVKEKIAQTLNYTKLPEYAIHHHIKSLPVDTLMTTNYDNLLEYVYNPEYSYKGKKTNKYLFEATSAQKDISFYHIHGHADSPKTICLGYEHYMGLVEKMRSEINAEEGRVAGKMKIKEALLDPYLPEIYYEEKLYDRLMRIVKKSSVNLLMKYDNVLGKLYPQEVVGMYEKYLNITAVQTADRKTYQEWVSIMNRMKKFTGRESAVERLKNDWQVKYKNRRALMDELKKA